MQGHLQYLIIQNAEPRFADNKLDANLKFNVTNGIVENVDFINYTDGITSDVNNTNTGNKLKRNASDKYSVFKLTLDITRNAPIECFPIYVYVKGTDGSKYLDMIIYTIDYSTEKISYSYHPMDKISLDSKNKENLSYTNCFTNYYSLYDLINKDGQLQ